MKDNQKYISFIVILVFGATYLASIIDGWFGNNYVSDLFSYGTVSLAIYGLFLLWQHILWKQEKISWLIAKIIGFHNFPNLSGKWKIDYESTYKNKTGVGEVVISQDYSCLYLDGNFEGSSCFESFVSMLKQKENKKWFLVYGYTSKPNNSQLTSSPSGGMHEGFTYLDVVSKNKLQGYYSNDENRKTRGKITLTKIGA